MAAMRDPSNQRGAAALAVAVIMLFAMTLVAFFGNRSLIFEQRTSANQFRSTKAAEMAEAGLEWAVARLNDTAKIQAAPSCDTTGPLANLTTEFAVRYLPLDPANPAVTGFGLLSDLRWPGCSIAANGTTTCSCPNVNNAYPAFGAADQPRFRVKFETVASDVWAVRITSFGCTNAGAPCDAAGTADAVAVVSAAFKMQPTVATAPGAGLVAGTTTVTGGNLRVVNLDPTSNGVTIDTGSTVTLGSGTEVNTLPGTPARASVLDGDTALLALSSSADRFFKSFFGVSIAEYKNDSRTTLVANSCAAGQQRCIACGNAGDCGGKISAAYDKGARQFWSDKNVSWSSPSDLPTRNAAGGSISTLGAPTPGDPIIFASSADTELKGNIDAYGMFYTETATIWDYDGSGTANVFGSFISRTSFDKGSGTLNLIYDARLFSEGGLRGSMVRVPGTWRDKLNEYTTAN